MNRHLCVVLHDVAPEHMAACRALLARVQRVARENAAAADTALPVTLLVVPCWHGRSSAPRDYLRWLHALRNDGHELTLHGWTHRDEAPPPHGWVERLLRRSYTAGEGEFSALTRTQAEARLDAARAWAATHGLGPMRGFVAPAWLASEHARSAVAGAGFDYTCTLTRVHNLARATELRSRAMVFSTRSAWRRAASVAWNGWLARRLRSEPLLRLELHPDDVAHPAVARCWTHALAGALRDRRQPLRLAEAAELAHDRLPA